MKPRLWIAYKLLKLELRYYHWKLWVRYHSVDWLINFGINMVIAASLIAILLMFFPHPIAARLP
jgi:hypothetical protein